MSNICEMVFPIANGRMFEHDNRKSRRSAADHFAPRERHESPNFQRNAGLNTDFTENVRASSDPEATM